MPSLLILLESDECRSEPSLDFSRIQEQLGPVLRSGHSQCSLLLVGRRRTGWSEGALCVTADAAWFWIWKVDTVGGEEEQRGHSSRVDATMLISSMYAKMQQMPCSLKISRITEMTTRPTRRNATRFYLLNRFLNLYLRWCLVPFLTI